MKRLLSILMVVILVMSFISNGLAKEIDTEYKPVKSYFVGFNSSVNVSLIKSIGGQVTREYNYMSVLAAKLPDHVIQFLINHAEVDYVEADGKVQAMGQEIPWGVPHVKASDVQDTGITGYGVKVGVIDTGIDYIHEDLKVSGGETFVDGTTDYMDDNGHGTHVAGTVAALNNTVGVLGNAPQASLYAIKVLDQYGGGNYSDVVAGIEWDITNNMDIINMSFGGNSGSQTLKQAVDNAYNSGILLVAAAGNNGYDRKGTITYPAKYDSVVAVGAIDKANERASFSSVGRELELVAPGVDILSTIPGGYASYNGTSMASPHVAGVAALVSEAKPELNNVDLRNILNETATTLGDSFSYGNGLVDALKAVNYSKTSTPVKGNRKK